MDRGDGNLEAISVRTLVSFFCLIRPAFLGATERTPGLVVLAGLVKGVLV